MIPPPDKDRMTDDHGMVTPIWKRWFRRVATGDSEHAFGLTIDGAGSVITAGIKGFVTVPVAGSIIRATLLSTDAAVTPGDIVIDVWQSIAYPPTAGDSIVGSAPPTLTSGIRSIDDVLTGWTRDFDAGVTFGFSVTSVALLERVTLVIDYEPVDVE